MARGPAEPPVYRPFALLGLAATLAGGIPLGVWLLAWLYLGVAAVPPEWILLHAHVQIFGFFGTLIMGVSHFTGRMVWLLGSQATGFALRIIGTAASMPAPVLIASVLQTVTFALFASWVWRKLDPRLRGRGSTWDCSPTQSATWSRWAS